VIDLPQARQVASAWLAAHQVRINDRLINLCILDEHTINTDFGWVSFWQPRSFVDSGNFSDTLAGNGPVIVDRRDGTLNRTERTPE
jgi:Immunity protein 35